jgi:23S rRNA pseudouridine1911/1915/1917 synthase
MLPETLVSNVDQVISNQIKIFWKDKEFWLLNRLDNETSWLLYFAKNLEIFDKYRQWQKEGKIKKFYIAQVFWKFNYNKIEINYPIMHHKSKADRMIFIKTPKDLLKWRSRQHNVKTDVQLLNYNEHSNISTLQIMITKWIRHQIRVHLSSLWYPIIWDSIYSNNFKQKSDQNLRLWSIWQKFDFSK